MKALGVATASTFVATAAQAEKTAALPLPVGALLFVAALGLYAALIRSRP